jgi:hypothetical protein
LTVAGIADLVIRASEQSAIVDYKTGLIRLGRDHRAQPQTTPRRSSSMPRWSTSSPCAGQPGGCCCPSAKAPATSTSTRVAAKRCSPPPDRRCARMTTGRRAPNPATRPLTTAGGAKQPRAAPASGPPSSPGGSALRRSTPRGTVRSDPEHALNGLTSVEVDLDAGTPALTPVRLAGLPPSSIQRGDRIAVVGLRESDTAPAVLTATRSVVVVHEANR